MIRSILAATLALILSGCATQYKEVYIPTRCEIEMPKRPAKTANTSLNVRNLLQYTELLEYNLDFCITGRVRQ